MLITPTPVEDVFMAFPANVEGKYMPHEHEIRKVIPKEYFQWDNDSWHYRLFQEWFNAGVKGLKMYPKEGINPEIAFRHIRAVMGSFQPKHEHKIAAVRWMFDNWFDKIEWESNE